MPPVPGAQTQPSAGDWLSKIGDFSKRLGVGAIGSLEGAMHMVGAAPQDFTDHPVPGNPGADYVQDPSANLTPQLRQLAGTPEPKDFSERLPEELGGVIINAPLAGAGKLAQGLNLLLSVGLPEAANAIGDAQAAPPSAAGAGVSVDPYAHDIDPYARPEQDVPPAPYAPKVDPTVDQGDPYARPSDWLDSALHDGRYWAGAGAVAATALATIALMRYGSSTAASLATRVSSLTGSNATPELTSLASKLGNTAFLDRNAPVKDFFAVLRPDKADLFDAHVDTKLNGPAIAQKVDSFYQTGQFPGSSIQSRVVPKDFYQAVGSQLTDVDPVLQATQTRLGWSKPADSGIKQFDDWLTARNELDIRNAAQGKWISDQLAKTGSLPNAAPEIRPNLWDRSTDELRQYVDAGKLNPKFVKLGDMHSQMMADTASYMYNKGVISLTDLNEMRSLYPNYAPISMRNEGTRMDRFQSWLNDKFLTKFDAQRSDAFDQLMNRGLGNHEGISGPLDPSGPNGAKPVNGVQLSSLAATDQYMQNVIRQSEINDVRKWFLGQASAWQRAQPSNSTQYFKPVGEAGADVVSFMDNGKRYNFQVKDPAMLQSLQANPVLTHSIWSATKNIMQTTVTGSLAPAFSIANLAHMTLRGALTREPGTAFGYIDWAMQKAGLPFGLRGDPTAAIGAVTGSINLLYNQSQKAFAGMMRQSIDNDGVLSKLFGNNAQSVADSVSDAYMRSTLHTMSEGGVGHGLRPGGMGDGELLSPLATAAPAYSGNPVGLKSLYNAYHNILGAVRNGAEAHYFALNDKAAATAADRVTLSALTRDFAGDPGRQGASRIVNGITSFMPYLNVTMQGNAKIARAFRDNPAGMVGGVISSIGVPAVTVSSLLANLDPAERDAYFKLTPEDRVSYMHIPMRGVPVEQWAKIPVAPELRGLWAAGMTLIDHIFGLSTQVLDHQDNRDIKSALQNMVDYMHRDDLSTAVMSQFYAGAPPLLQAGLGAAGFNLNPGGPGGSITTMGGQRLDPGSTPTKNQDDVIGSPMEKVVTSLFGQLGQIGISMWRDFHYASQGTDSYLEGIKAAGSAGVDELKKRVPEIPGGMWDTQQRLSPHNTDLDQLTRKSDAIKELNRVFTTQVQQGGAVSPAGQPLVINHGGMQDADMTQVLTSLNAFEASTLKPILDKRSNMYSQLAAINGASSLDRKNKEASSTGYVKTVEELNRAALGAIDQWEAEMTASHPMLAARLGGQVTVQKLGATR